MKKLIGLAALLLAFALPGFAQGHGLSPDDQSRFDSYCARWIEYRQTNNHDQEQSMEERMRDVMSRNGIPGDVPFERIASNGRASGYGDRDQDRDGDRGRDRNNNRGGDRDDDRGYDRWRGRLQGDDQRKFDSYFSRWQQYRQNHDRDQIVSMEHRMNDVMARNGIPEGTPYWRVASNVDWHGWVRWNRQLSPEDQGRFDSYFSRWLEYRRRADWDQIRSMEARMEDVMAHYNIPRDVPYDVIASEGR